MGIEAVTLNVHYTDGAYKDPSNKTYKMATDGIKIHYTPDLREYTSLRKQLINVPYGPKEMMIPPATDRFFLTRTCVVDTSCRDATDEQLQRVAMYLGLDKYFDAASAPVPSDEMLANISCETVKPFCFLSQFGPYVQKLCPVSCGLCDIPSNDDGNSLATPQVNPRDPSRYRISSINYHAHLLGREMYATLRREKETTDQQDSVSSMTHRNADLNGLSSTIIQKDLKSREMWNYDNQETIPMNKEFVIDINENDGTGDDTLMMIKGVEVKPGD